MEQSSLGVYGSVELVTDKEGKSIVMIEDNGGSRVVRSSAGNEDGESLLGVGEVVMVVSLVVVVLIVDFNDSSEVANEKGRA
jgi:hypothetical protein